MSCTYTEAAIPLHDDDDKAYLSGIKAMLYRMLSDTWQRNGLG